MGFSFLLWLFKCRDGKYCDATIEAGGEQFKIHKNVFGMHSDFFDKAFTVEVKNIYYFQKFSDIFVF